MKDRIEAMTMLWGALLLALAIAHVLLPERADRFGAAHVGATILAGGAIVLSAITIRRRLRLGARMRLVTMRRKAQTDVRHVVTSGLLLLAMSSTVSAGDPVATAEPQLTKTVQYSFKLDMTPTDKRTLTGLKQGETCSDREVTEKYEHHYSCPHMLMKVSSKNSDGSSASSEQYMGIPMNACFALMEFFFTTVENHACSTREELRRREARRTSNSNAQLKEVSR